MDIRTESGGLRQRMEAAGAARMALAAVGVAGLAWLAGAFAGPAATATDAEASLSAGVEAAIVAAGVVKGESLAGSWDLPNLDHERVDYWVDRFVTDSLMREKMEGFLHRAGLYVPMLVERLDERGMPRDLVYLAMIESGFQANAYSRAQASGLWQFIAETGQRYGLAIDRAVDERNDPIRATDAALDYLQDLHDRFGSWYLAAAAYNTGENRVGRIMREEYGRERAAGEEDYYRIWSRLPGETRDYVPLMIAAARISKQPAKYGFGHVEPASPLRYHEVVVPPATALEDIARAAGVTLEELRALNPHFRIHRTPNDRDYPVRLPVGAASRFAESAAGGGASVDGAIVE